jgi:transposase-like protein
MGAPGPDFRTWESNNPHGPVEIDERYIGRNPKAMHADKRLKLRAAENGYAQKPPVLGMIDRKTREVRATVLSEVRRDVVQAHILKHCGFATKIYTDNSVLYDKLDTSCFIHKTVNHATEYVKRDVHTQAIESFWSCLKRTLTGTYVAVEAFHLDLYLNEQVFRFNNRRNKNDGDRFRKALSMIGERRLTWNRLTGKEGA